MNILVCVKQVPQSETATSILPNATWISRTGHADYKMNRFDECAVEEALRIKEKVTGVHVDILTLGPGRSKEVVKRALGMGADNGTHLVFEDDIYLDPFVVSGLLAEEAGKKGYDLILTGIMSEDLMQAQTGQMLAAHLNLPCVTSVIGIERDDSFNRINVARETEGGIKSLMSVSLPCVITVQAGINVPRYPNLSGILKANEKTIKTVPVFPGPNRTQCERVSYPEKKREGRVLKGSRQAQARELITLLFQKTS